MLSLPSPFCSNNSRTLSALKETFTNASQPTPDVLIRKNSDSQNTSGKGGGAKEAKKMREFGPSPPLSRLLNSATHGPSTNNAKNLITQPKLNFTRASRVQKTRPRTITRGPKSYLSAHRDPRNKKEFDNATETLTRAALRPE